MAIDYGRLISRTWEVFSRNRVLWLLGLIVALTSGNFSTNFDYNNTSGSRVQEFLDQYGSVLLALGCGAFIIGIIFSFISAAGEAALVATTDHIERTKQQPSFAEAWGLGWPKMFPVWLFNLIFGIIALVIVLILLLPFFVLFGGSIMAAIGASSSNGGDDAIASAVAGALGLGCICLCVALIILIPLTIALGIARDHEVTTPLASLCRDMWAGAGAVLGPQADHTAVALLSEKLAGSQIGKD
jgi:hypothetical protein